MNRLIAFLSLFASPALAQVPDVATDIAPVQSLVAQVMGELGTPELVVRPGASPHGYAMRPSEARALAGADLVVWVGPGLTPWLEEPLETLAGNARQIVLLNVPKTLLLETREGAMFEAHDHDHGHGHDEGHEEAHEEGHDADHEDKHADEHGHEDEHAHEEDHGHEDDHAHEEGHDDGHADAHDDKHADEHAHDDDHGHEDAHAGEGHGANTDPHAWLDPHNAALWMEEIAHALSELDPANAQTYADNAKAGIAALEQLENEIAADLAPLSGRGFLVLHDAFHYFEARFGVEASGSVSATDADKPGAARIAELRNTLQEADIVCAFSEPQLNAGLLETVLEGQGARLHVLDPIGADLPLGPALYPAVLREIAAQMQGCLTP